jgi:hypothetical protein
MKPQVGVVYGHGETGLYTHGVRTLGSVREGRRALVTVGSGKMCVRIENSFGNGTGVWKSRYAKSRGNLSHPIGRTRVTRSSLSGIRKSKVREGSPSTSQVAKLRENHSRPSEEDRWQQSRSRRSVEEIQDSGLVNSEFAG